MINIMKSDLYRILKGKVIYIVLLVVIFVSILNSMLMQAGNVGISFEKDIDNLNDVSNLKEYRDLVKEVERFELDKDILGHNINLYYLFFIIVAIILTTDFSNKSIKNTLSSAITKKEYYFSKLFLILAISTILVFFNNYLNYFMNLIINGKKFASPLGEIIKITVIQLPLLYGIISLLTCFAFILRRTSLFNTISIPFIVLIQLLAEGGINLFKIKADWFYDYELQFALEKLANSPTNQYIITCMILAIVYIMIFNIIGYISFKKAEIN